MLLPSPNDGTMPRDERRKSKSSLSADDPRLAPGIASRFRTSRASAAGRIAAATVLAVGSGPSACDRPEQPAEARQIFVVEGFDQPESVQYDPAQDIFFVSNMAGLGSSKDGIGYIKWFSAEDPHRSGMLAESGVEGVTLHAPKGLALQGDTLWAADIDVLRGFHRRTGAPVAEIDLAPHGAVLLNAIAVAPDGTLYVSDSGIIMSEVGVIYAGGAKIFSIGRNAEVAVIAEGEDLRFPNGIRWNAADDRLIVASFDPFVGEAYSLDRNGGTRVTLTSGPARLDGIAVLGPDRFLAGSWSDSTLYEVTSDSRRPLIDGLWQPADFDVDTRRNRVAIPLVLPGQVGIWQLPD